MLTKVFCTAAPLYYIFVLWWDYTYVDLSSFMAPNVKREEFFKGRLKFLTMWNMLLQATFFTICLLNNYVGTDEINPKTKPLIRKIRDLILAALAFPLSLYVGVTFWSIYAVDRELIFPKALDAFFPAWLNHAMHTNIMFFIFIQVYLSYHEYPSRKAGIAILSTFMFTYLVWIHILHAYTGVWVYPVLEVLNFPVRLIFFVISLGIGILLYIIGEKLNSFLWSSTVEKNKRKKHN